MNEAIISQQTTPDSSTQLGDWEEKRRKKEIREYLDSFRRYGVSRNEPRKITYQGLSDDQRILSNLKWGLHHSLNNVNLLVDGYRIEPDVKAEALSTLARQRDVLDWALKTKDGHVASQASRGAANLINHGNRYQRIVGCGLLTSNIYLVEQYINGEVVDWTSYVSSLESLLGSGSRKQQQLAWNVFENNYKDKEKGSEWFNKFYGRENVFVRHKVWDFLDNELSGYGLDTQGVIFNWTRGYSLRDGIFKNLSPLRSLAEVPEVGGRILSSLNKDFGINHFGRYPHDWLLKQYQSGNTDIKSETSLPIIYPLGDGQGVFYGHRKYFEGALQPGITPFVAEIGNVEGLLSALELFAQRNGEASSGIIGGHGTGEGGIAYGDGDLELTHLEDRNYVNRLLRVFSPHPSLLLVSCSSGVEGGIAQKLSKVLQAKVYAPKYDTDLRRLHIGRVRGEWLFDVKFADGEMGRDRKMLRGDLAIYDRGLLLAA